MTLDAVRDVIRDIPDFPKPGILFKDITPILADPDRFRETVDYFVDRHKDRTLHAIAAVESRGFLFGAVMAYRLGIGMIPIRKKGKLPADTIEASYELEYGSATLEMHRDALAEGDEVVLIDDLLATGGTAEAAARLVEQLGGKVVEMDFVIELAFLNGRDRLSGYQVHAPIVF